MNISERGIALQIKRGRKERCMASEDKLGAVISCMGSTWYVLSHDADILCKECNDRSFITYTYFEK